MFGYYSAARLSYIIVLERVLEMESFHIPILLIPNYFLSPPLCAGRGAHVTWLIYASLLCLLFSSPSGGEHREPSELLQQGRARQWGPHAGNSQDFFFLLNLLCSDLSITVLLVSDCAAGSGQQAGETDHSRREVVPLWVRGLWEAVHHRPPPQGERKLF